MLGEEESLGSWKYQQHRQIEYYVAWDLSDVSSYFQADHVQVGDAQIAALQEWLLNSDDLVKTDVGVELGLNIGEDDNGAVGTTTAVMHG